jgi:hypothetical protein
MRSATCAFAQKEIELQLAAREPTQIQTRRLSFYMNPPFISSVPLVLPDDLH